MFEKPNLFPNHCLFLCCRYEIYSGYFFETCNMLYFVDIYLLKIWLSKGGQGFGSQGGG